ncbi:redoxin domain-containing protein [Rhizobium binae]|uniref:redoxin domain-containing protein n=1 Tax=Rhizobium binae TaxID=1138190 RepID=UPI0021809DDD|nr:redoxin domain-containing protein [Rhizobium binae]
MDAYENILPGDPAPYQGSMATPRYAFDTAAGRYLVLCLFGSASHAGSKAAIAAAFRRSDVFDDVKASFFGVTIDSTDETEQRVDDRYPGYRFFLDFDGTISRLYGAIPIDAKPGDRGVPVRQIWIVIDPTMRVLKVLPFAEDGSDIEAVVACLCFASDQPDFRYRTPRPHHHASKRI